jgi:hypothetical protein
LIYDYYKKIEARTSELGIIAERAIEFRDSNKRYMVVSVRAIMGMMTYMIG